MLKIRDRAPLNKVFHHDHHQQKVKVIRGRQVNACLFIQGKPLSHAKEEVRYAASFVEWFSEEAKRVYGDVVPTPVSSKRLFILKQPVGVAAMWTPVN